MTDTETLRKLVEAGEKATQGEWCWGMRYVCKKDGYIHLFQTHNAEICEEGAIWEDNAEFVKQAANSRSALKSILERLNRYESCLKNMEHFGGDLWPQNETVKTMIQEAKQALDGGEALK